MKLLSPDRGFWK